MTSRRSSPPPRADKQEVLPHLQDKLVDLPNVQEEQEDIYHVQEEIHLYSDFKINKF